MLEFSEDLNLVTKTLTATKDKVLSLGILFFLVLMAYSITGVASFGVQLYAFRDLGSAMSTLMRVLMGQPLSS